MNKSAYVKELLEYGVKFNELHCIFGFDFEAPFEVVKLSGKFTAKSLRASVTFEDDFILLFSDLKWYNRDLLLASVTGENIHFRFSTSSMYNPYTKKDFEEARKRAQEVYILWQDAKYKTPIRAPKNCNGEYIGTLKREADYSDRFIKKGCCFWQNNAKVYGSWHINERGLDKSGYMVADKRDTLKQKARALHEERSKAKADSIDLEYTISKMKDAFNSKKREVIRLLENDNFSGFSFGYFGYAQEVLKDFVSRYEAKSFANYESIKAKEERFYYNLAQVIK